MKTICLFLVSLFFTLSSTFAQTKLIAFKSHSGNMAHFEVALEKNLFDIGHSNFGAAPMRMVKYARLDSLIHLSDSTVVMITSNICKAEFGNDSTLWFAGKDTLVNHPLFGQRYAKDSIKTILDQSYNFVNKADSVTFIGYDPIESKPQQKAKSSKKKKEKKQPKKKEVKPQKEKQQLIKVQKELPSPEIQAFSFNQTFLILLGLALLGMIYSFVSIRLRK